MIIKGSASGEETRVDWDYGTELAQELLASIQILGTTNIKRVEGQGFKAYWVYGALRVDIEQTELRD